MIESEERNRMSRQVLWYSVDIYVSRYNSGVHYHIGRVRVSS